MLLNKVFLIFVILMFMSSCSSSPELKLKELPEPPIIKQYSTPVIVKITEYRNKLLDKPINTNINDNNIGLADAINIAAPNISVAVIDKDVMLNQKISIRASELTTFDVYLKQLSNITGYNIFIKDKTVYIASNVEKLWDLSTLALDEANLEPTILTQDKDAPQKISANNNWQSILTNIKVILGNNSIVTDNKQLGQIYAIAPIAKINLADKFLKNLIRNSKKQIHFDIAIIETNVNNASGAGLDLSLSSKSSSNNGAVLNISKLLTSPLIFDDVNLDILIDILNKKGYAKIRNQPNIRMRNGTQITISTGDDISYVSSLESTTDKNGNVITTPVIKTINVGLSIKLAAKVSDNNKLITLNITPVVSSIISFTELSTGSGQASQELKLPNIALTELSTQVTVRPNESVLIGGLYADVVSKAAKSSGNFLLNAIFASDTKSVSEKEILLFITPHLLEL